MDFTGVFEKFPRRGAPKKICSPSRKGRGGVVFSVVAAATAPERILSYVIGVVGTAATAAATVLPVATAAVLPVAVVAAAAETALSALSALSVLPVAAATAAVLPVLPAVADEQDRSVAAVTAAAQGGEEVGERTEKGVATAKPAAGIALITHR